MIAVVAEAYSLQACLSRCAGAGFYTGSASVEGKLTMVMVIEQMHTKTEKRGKNTKKFLFLHLMCCSLPWPQWNIGAEGIQVSIQWFNN